jgi:hypothetical protein
MPSYRRMALAAALISTGGNPTGERYPALDPSRVEPSVTMRKSDWMYDPAPSNWSPTYRSISQGGRLRVDPRSHHSTV